VNDTRQMGKVGEMSLQLFLPEQRALLVSSISSSKVHKKQKKCLL